MLDLAATSALLRLLSDPTRVRLLALLEREELTVAELSAVLRLAQPRVSTHLAKLKEAGLVRDRRSGVSSYYRYNSEIDPEENALLLALKESVDDALLRDDESRLPSVLAKRARAEGWADTVAGDMERHYSPGRTWEALARGMTQLVETGDVLDIASGDGVLAELLAPRAHSIVCVDASERVVAAARVAAQDIRQCRGARRRHARPRFPGEELRPGFADARPHLQREARHGDRRSRARAAPRRPSARRHAGPSCAPFRGRAVRSSQSRLQTRGTARVCARAAKLDVVACERLTRERRPPHFEVLSLLARKTMSIHLPWLHPERAQRCSTR